MIDMLKLAKILETVEDITVNVTESGILISDVNEEQVVPSDIINFVKLYEKENNIQVTNGGYVITTTTFSGQTFMLLLLSVFGAEYDFKVTGAYEVTATKKGKEGVREDLEVQEKIEVDFLKIAEAIDSSATEIEIHEDGLKITCANKSAIAEKIDSMNPTLNIEITNEYVLVSEGE